MAIATINGTATIIVMSSMVSISQRKKLKMNKSTVGNKSRHSLKLMS